MSERKTNILRGALAMAVGGALTYAALKRTPSIEEAVISTARQALNYEKRKIIGTVDQIHRKIPGSPLVAEVLAEILSSPESRWEEVNRDSFRSYIHHSYLSVECRQSSIGPELLVARAFRLPSQRSRLQWGVSREAQTDYWIIGKGLDPYRARMQSED